MALLVLSDDDNKQLVTASAKHLRATERSSWVYMVTRQMTPFFSPTIWNISVGTFHFCISRPSKFSSIRHPFCLCFGVYNPVLHNKSDNFKPVVGTQTRNLCHA